MTKEDSNTIVDAIKFYLLANKLKDLLRQGWVYWCVEKERIESVAEHSFSACILAIAMDSQFKYNIDLNKVLKTLIIHDLEEAIIGDLTVFDLKTKQDVEAKESSEKIAIDKVFGNLLKSDEYAKLSLDFINQSTNEAKFAFLCDKLDCLIQAKIYEDQGYNNLDNPNNILVRSDPRVQNFLKEGAKTIAELFCLNGKKDFDADENFMEVLKFVYSNNLQNISKM